jgi:toxoflavin synthase
MLYVLPCGCRSRFGGHDVIDFGQIKNYASYVKDDPFRRGLHFPAVEDLLGDLNRKRILDIGCGDGLFPRLPAERGAPVIGYDRAHPKIAEAQAHEDVQRLDATFIVATPHTFLHSGTVDAATSVLVLMYATSTEELAVFFRSASRHLVSGGKFISVVFNPLFSLLSRTSSSAGSLGWKATKS